MGSSLLFWPNQYQTRLPFLEFMTALLLSTHSKKRLYIPFYNSIQNYKDPKLIIPHQKCEYVDSIPFRRLMLEQNVPRRTHFHRRNKIKHLMLLLNIKTPGPDRFPIEWYLTHRYTSVPRLCNLYYAILKN